MKRSKDHRASHGAVLSFPAAPPAALCHVPPAQSTLRLFCSSLLCESCEPAMLAGSVSFVRLARAARGSDSHSYGLRGVACIASDFRPPA